MSIAIKPLKVVLNDFLYEYLIEHVVTVFFSFLCLIRFLTKKSDVYVKNVMLIFYLVNAN